MEKEVSLEEINILETLTSWKFLLGILIGIIILTGVLIYSEIFQAKKSCEKIKGTYALTKLKHFCNNKSYYKYSDGRWDFNRTINFISRENE